MFSLDVQNCCRRWGTDFLRLTYRSEDCPEIEPSIDRLAPDVTVALSYAAPMAALTDDQIDLLQRAREGLPMWGGSVATNRLRREVELLLAMRLVESGGSFQHRLTELGAQVLDAVA